MDRQPPPTSPTQVEDVRQLRAEPRDSMFLLATVRRPRGVDVPVKVRNLSPGGMMAECPSGFARGDPILVELRGIGIVPGKVAWTAVCRIGVQFDEAVDHRMARLQIAGGPQPQLVRAPRSTWRPSVR